MEEHQRAWRQDVLAPLIEEKSAAVFESAEADAAAILAQVDQIQMDLSGQQLEANDVTTWQRVVGASGGFLVGGVGLAVSGGLNGIGKELAASLGIQVGAYSLLMLLGMFNPITVGATIIGMFLFNWGRAQSNAMKKLKENMIAHFTEEMTKSEEENTNELADQVTAQFEEIARTIIAGLDVEIGNVSGQMEGIIAEMEQGREKMARREEIIVSCEEEIKGLSIQLDELIFDLVKG